MHALGLVLTEMLTDAPPYDGDDGEEFGLDPVGVDLDPLRLGGRSGSLFELFVVDVDNPFAVVERRIDVARRLFVHRLVAHWFTASRTRSLTAEMV